MHKAELRKLICSMLLGDGFISEKQLRFGFQHSVVQRDYAIWKKSLIDNFFEKKSVIRKNYWYPLIKYFNKKTQKNYYSCQYYLIWPKYMRIFRKWVYRADKTKKAMFLLNQINSNKHLAIWFLDDGSETSNKTKYGFSNPRLTLHTNSFLLSDVKQIREWFKIKYDLDPRIIFFRKIEPCLRFTVKDSRKLFPMISVYVKQFEFSRKKFSKSLERYC